MGRFPDFNGTMRRSDFPPPFPDHFGAGLSFTGTTCARIGSLRLWAARGPRTARVVWSRGNPWRRENSRGDDGISQVPWEPPVHAPRSSTPARPPRQAHCGASVLPIAAWIAAALARSFSRLNHAARALAVYASQCRLPERHARLASDWWL